MKTKGTASENKIRRKTLICLCKTLSLLIDGSSKDRGKLSKFSSFPFKNYMPFSS